MYPGRHSLTRAIDLDSTLFKDAKNTFQQVLHTRVVETHLKVDVDGVRDPAVERGRLRLDHERVGRLLQEDGQRVLRWIAGG